jgi:5-methylcytosine-specific restriction enzyme A
MPVKPKHSCSMPGCAALIAEGSRCPVHQAAYYRQQDAGRPSATHRGYDTRWRRLRLRVLAREPLCRSCRARGLIKAAIEIDHIVPLNLAWGPDGLMVPGVMFFVLGLLLEWLIG